MIRQRMSTGIEGLDEILHGGLIPHHSYLLVGSPGTGKTVLSLQWLLQGEDNKEKPLYISLAEHAKDIKKNVTGFGWKLDKIHLVDFSPQMPAGDDKPLPLEEYHVFSPSEVEQKETWERIYQTIEEKKPKRLVIDSVTQLRYLSTDDYQFRKQVLNLVAFLNRQGITSFLLFEPTELERETSVALAVDGVIRLRMDISPSRVIALRTIEITKLRGTGFLSGYHPLSIESDGICIYPHRIEKTEELDINPTLIKSGISNLDLLLGGGIESGTSTIISGPTGVGKSTLGVQFLINACTKTSRSIIYTFEEAPNFIISRCEKIGIPIKEKIKKGTFKIVRINPMEIYPDQFLQIVRNDVEKEHCKYVMIDSLRGYHLAMEQYGTMLAHVQNLVTYLRRQDVTSFLINEVEEITGNLRVTDLGLSHLGDNAILLRYAECDGQVIKVVTCLKKRLGGFQPELRRFIITEKGIVVEEKLQNMRGVLTGVPTSLT